MPSKSQFELKLLTTFEDGNRRPRVDKNVAKFVEREVRLELDLCAQSWCLPAILQHSGNRVLSEIASRRS